MSKNTSGAVDIPSSDWESAEAQSQTTPYRLFQHRAVALRLRNVQASGRLGSGPAEPNSANYSAFMALVRTMPYDILGFQMVWSTLVTFLAYKLSRSEDKWFSVEFWDSRLVISSSISYGVGWALFVLLGFFIREASNRYWEAKLDWEHMGGHLRQIIRHLRQGYPDGTWHDGDLDRIAAHVIAYPIVLKMSLRGEREFGQLQGILHDSDIHDILKAPSMHRYCLSIVRAYFSASEEDANHSFKYVAATRTPAGDGTRFTMHHFLDHADAHTGSIVKIASSTPSIGYVTHLRLLLYIWMLFLPLALVKNSGWFTILWAILITYGIGMLFTIGQALSDPFGFDVHDIKLNSLAADTALKLLDAFSREKLELGSVVAKQHDNPDWLEKPVQLPKERQSSNLLGWFKSLILRGWNKSVLFSVGTVVLWTVFLVYLTHEVQKSGAVESCRWWCIYIPLDSSITAYVSLGIFLVLGFWLNVAYSRYWSALQLWQSKFKTGVEQIAFFFAMACRQGTWHIKDRERLFSHLVALCYAAKLELRGSRDTSELHGILSHQDVKAFDESEDFYGHAMDVLFGYINSIERVHSETIQVSFCPFKSSKYAPLLVFRALDRSMGECTSIHKHPIPKSYTMHLKLFTFFWLALLPMSLIEFSGFLSFLYIIPISYSVVRLIGIGSNLADPFGYDKEDIPLDTFCSQVKQSVHDIYSTSLQGTPAFVYASDYSREAFTAVPLDGTQNGTLESSCTRSKPSFLNWRRISKLSLDEDVNPSIVGSLKKVVNNIPPVSIRQMVLVTIWSVAAVGMSYGFSHLWSETKRNTCNAWCSPVDVETHVLANIGFALFMILSFRASDAIGRYEDGAMLIFNIQMNLRAVAMEAVQNYTDNFFHQQDKERIVAHLVQIPLCFRDLLLGIVRDEPTSKEGLLSNEDRNRFEASQNPLEHLIQTVEAYFILQDSVAREGHPDIPKVRTAGTFTETLLIRMSKVREAISLAIGVKRFPVISSYTRHQHMFTILWLALLPFAMTPNTGFFTILWAPLISFGVLGLEEIAEKLVDPYGNDAIDLPLDKMCLNVSSSIIQGVSSINWGLDEHIQSSRCDNAPQLGAVLSKSTPGHEYTLAHFDKSERPADFGEGDPLRFEGPRTPNMKPGLLAHIIRSVPWWVLVYITAWTTAATIISYLARDKSQVARWWQSNFSVNTTVATYLSFAAFMLLGFFVRAAFVRYLSAGGVWGSRLHSYCHGLAVQFQTLFPEATFHEGDHRRILAHLAAIPLVLKSELRNSRDIRELQGLLSHKDLGRLQCAESMVTHCVDVLRSYLYFVTNHSGKLHKPFYYGRRVSMVKFLIHRVEEMVRDSMFLGTFEIAPGFQILLNTFLGLWFLILPFALAEYSGWFTILWVPIVAYGVLGMHAIARELQFPFGSDLNDLDLDTMADSIVADILFVQKHIKPSPELLVHESPITPFWNETPGRRARKRRIRKTFCRKLLDNIKLAMTVFSFVETAGVAGWTALCVLVAWAVSRRFPFDDEIEAECSNWFCSRIAVNDSVKEYIGFALFLLLGFRMYESHGRYTDGFRLLAALSGRLHVISNRIFESYQQGDWHKNDLQRIAAHLAALPVALMGQLRNDDCEEHLRRILGKEDCEKMQKAHDQSEYCLDVIHFYLMEGDRWSRYEKDKPHAGNHEHWFIFWYMLELRKVCVDLKEIVSIPMPYGYVQHLRIFLVIWLLLLPLGLVESSGWLTILWTPFIAFGIVGIEKWSAELANPFGVDVSDVPIEKFVSDIGNEVKGNLKLFKDGTKPFLREERGAFPENGQRT